MAKKSVEEWGKQPIEFTESGLQDAADYFTARMKSLEKTHINTSGLNFDIGGDTDMKDSILTLVRAVYWE